MPHADFVHLRVHTAYSLAEGAITVKDLAKLCKSNAMPAVPITDTTNLFGALEFAVAASEAGVQPIIGAELHLKRETGQTKAGLRVVAGTAHVASQPDHLVLLAQNEAGYRNLMALVSRSYLDSEPGDPAQIPWSALDGATDGLLALTGGPSGAVGRLLGEGQADEAERVLESLKTLFPGRLYMEIQRHGAEAERRIEGGLLALAYRHDVPLVATNECFFPDEGLYEAHDALLCIAAGTTVSDPKRRRVTRHHRFKSAAEMRTLFADLPEAVDNTLVIARRCAFMPRPLSPILPAFDTAEGHDEPAALRRQAAEGLERRLAAHVFTPGMDEAAREAAATAYRERLDFELGVIVQMGFAGYFLIVADFIGWAKARGIPVGPGRGSGAGSVVAWSLLITDLDPLRWGLLFERFLNPERVSMPDFDIDFCQDRRGEVISYVQQKYGQDRVAQIITFGKLQARAALRDVGRVLELPYGQVDRICKMVPNNPANPVTLAQALQSEPALRAQRDEDEAVARLIHTALKLEGLYRNASTHAAGVVIGDRPLTELVALYRDPRSDMPATQFNMKWVEMAGLVKFDFLGLKTLTVLQKAVELVGRRGVSVDLEALPLDDTATYEMISRADTVGVFQLEGTGMRDMLRKMKPDRFEDIIALVALYRPGPMANIPKYIACKHGEEMVDYPHPLLEPILKETFGIMIYQEQVQQAAQVLAGYTLGGADLLRRAMGKKIKAEMDAQRETFVKGAVERGIDKSKASAIFDLMAAFAGYGFNKSHAAAYALVAYQTAYMKANHPVEFLAASMTYDMQNTDKLAVFRQELQAQRIVLLPPDINASMPEFTVEPQADGAGAVRYALAAVKNVGGQAMRTLVEAREVGGPFRNLGDFAGRVDGRSVNKRLLENLTKSGAFDRIVRNRAQLFAGLETLLKHANAAAEQRSSSQVSLFGADTGTEAPRIMLPDLPDWTPMERLQHEHDALGFYLSAHPLDAYGATLERIGVIESESIQATAEQKGGSARINLAGIVTACRIRTSAKGNRYAFVALADRTGSYEVTVFSEVLAQARELLESGKAVLVRADVGNRDGDLRLTATKIELLDEAVSHAAQGLKIYLREAARVPHIVTLLGQQPRGRGRVKVVVQTDAQEIELALPQAYQINARLRSAVKSFAGVVDVRDM